ncbi:EAL domain-containing protein [Emcibacter sp.]|uniref:GGDEF/EAL domain-containing response regulator n=1 Tax=Emcibacter sp. TaxID=1979954 RepID=UPI002AA6F5CD|nr:EAL domain-containing protein [Emcibacter sp.]
MNILLVDDDIVDREHVKRTLKRTDAQCEVAEATTVEDGLKLFHKQHFDVVLLDYKMPQRDGIEMLLELRTVPKEVSTAIVMMSNSEDEEIAQECLKAGAQDFLVKGEINATRLRRAILNAQTRFDLERKLYDSYSKVKELAEQDSLTGLANRYMFDETLKLALANNNRKEHKVALLLIDLDNFKYVNDTHGHDVGDELLKKVVDRIQKNLRGEELFARLGGDEFAIILGNLRDTQHASKVAQRILSAMGAPFEIGPAQVKTAPSIGIAIHPDDGASSEEVFKFADIAMYRAKKLGKNQICFFEQEMQEQFSVRYDIEHKLHTAIEKDMFVLHYQPIVNLSDDHVCGFEALVRCTFDDTMRSPDVFIPIAEESRLILPIGRWVIREALEQLSRWNQKTHIPLTLSVNISPVQLTDQHLPDFIRKQLEKNGIPPELLELELTETALLDNTQGKRDVIEELHGLGCRIALDDFGTGFSSVSHLQNFPISTVKIDRSLMPGISEECRSRSLLRGLSAMAHSLGLAIVAEGIETEYHLSFCREMGIHKAQGYHLGRPQPIEELEEGLLAGNSLAGHIPVSRRA